MAKRVKFNPTYNKREQKVDTLFEEILKELPEETRQEMESMGIHSFDELYEMMLSVGIHPMKMMDYSMKHKEIPADFNPKDVMLDEESYEDDDAELLELRTKKAQDGQRQRTAGMVRHHRRLRPRQLRPRMVAGRRG